MKLAGRRCLVCTCEGTMPLDAERLARALGSAAPPVVHHQLCRGQIASFERAAASGEPLLVACTQEAPLFTQVAGRLEGAGDLAFTNIRERAGWSDEAEVALPKIAALLAEAAPAPRPAPTLTLHSEGRCLVYGMGQQALDAAARLSGRLAVTLLLLDAEDAVPPRLVELPILRGRVERAQGRLGAFRVTVAGLAAVRASSRRELAFDPPNPEPTVLEADLVLDLSGGMPLFPAHGKRDGYLRPDLRDPLAVERALFAATDLVGEFEKPRYVGFTAELCAHSRSRRTGCTRCLDVCPTGAIAPAGDHVAIDPYVCAGCGSCATVCPTGAATYAAPAPADLLGRLRTLLLGYARAGGTAPVLLACEERHGEDIVAMAARFGRGLPARVLPFAVTEVTQLGLDFVAAAFAYGASAFVVLLPPTKRDEAEALAQQLGYAEAVLAGLGWDEGRVALLAEDDPEAVEATLWSLPRLDGPAPADFLALGGKRERTRLALDHLHRTAPVPIDVIELPERAPFGTLRVDIEGCTLCLSCVGACPTGALLDGADQPMLRFVEDACVQCGLCANTCPERVIALEPRLSFAPEAKAPRTIKAEEPATCTRCGKAFGTKSSIERVVAKLAGTHWMFQSPEQIARMRMCDDCRVVDQFASKPNPLAAGARPPVRTTDDYLREREERERTGERPPRPN